MGKLYDFWGRWMAGELILDKNHGKNYNEKNISFNSETLGRENHIFS